MRRILKPRFFNRDTKLIARELLGKFLVKKIGKKEIASMITETEAYDGPKDLASHASKGKTARTELMFGHPGYFYIYLCYGMYFMLNIVTREEGYPAAVLIRGAGILNGPGKVTKYFKIYKKLNGKLADEKNGLWFEDRGVKISKNKILTTARVGVNYAGPIWAKKKLRYIIKK